MLYTSTSTFDTDSGTRTSLAKTFDKDSGNLTEQTESRDIQMWDEDGVFKGSEYNGLTTYYDSKGTSLRTEAISRKSDENWQETTKTEDTSAVLDGVDGAILASIQIRGETSNIDGVFFEKRSSANQDGVVIASFERNWDEDGSGSKALTQYFHEDSGALRKSEETIHDSSREAEGIAVVTTTVKNAAGIVTEITELSDGPDGAIEETRKFDSVTGELKTIKTRSSDYGQGSETVIKNAGGIMLSKAVETYVHDEAGAETIESAYSEYDPASGELIGGGKIVSGSEYLEELGYWSDFEKRYDLEGRKVSEWSSSPVLDNEGEPIGYAYSSTDYNAEGKAEWGYRDEMTYVLNDKGEHVGYTSVAKDENDNILSTSEFTYQFAENGNQIGETGSTVYYNADGSVRTVASVNNDFENNEYAYESRDAGGMLLNRRKETAKYSADYDMRERETVEESYSELTGNLMTTTTIRTSEEPTGAYEMLEDIRKANGDPRREAELSYTFVPEYGYLDYVNRYTDYIYYADGALKYKTEGVGLIDNFYLDLFNKRQESQNFRMAAMSAVTSMDFDEEPQPTQILETTTTAVGVVKEDYNYNRNLEDGWYSNDFTSETKTYDETSGELLSITSRSLDEDPVTMLAVDISKTVSSSGQLLEEAISTVKYDTVSGYTDLGETKTAFNEAGKQTLSYVRDADGAFEKTSSSYDAQTGALLISSTAQGDEDGQTSKTLTYDPAGNVILSKIEKSTADSILVETRDAAGKVLEQSVGVKTEQPDGTVIWRYETTDTLGRKTYDEDIMKVDESGNLSDVRYEGTYYDQSGALRRQVREGGVSVVYDEAGQVVTRTTQEPDGGFKTTDASGNLLYYGVPSDTGTVSEYYADGSPRLIVERDDDGETRRTSFDDEGYINYVVVREPEIDSIKTYDGDGKLLEVIQNASETPVVYDAVENTWYSGTGDSKVEIAPPDTAEEIDHSEIETGGKKKPLGSWYPNNTTGTFGIHLRDIRPDLTDKWYTVTPVDLSNDGTQSFELIGGSMWIIGQVNVKVEGDNVTVTYDIIKDGTGRTTTNSEYLNIFSDINSITEEMLEGDSEDGKGYVYGEPISIQQDLAGDTNVLLYVNNGVDFNTRVYGDQYLTRMWENLPERREQRTAMMDMMDPYMAESVEGSGE